MSVKPKVKRHTQNQYTSQPYDDKLAPSSGCQLDKGPVAGKSLEVLRRFPADVQGDLGYALYQVQLGQMPPDSKPIKTVGPGVYELRDRTHAHGTA